jgi:phosphate transport system substrate-binding protein
MFTTRVPTGGPSLATLRPMKASVMALCAVLFAVATAGCGGSSSGNGNGGDGLSGRIEADGSSTVGPFTTAAAERFRTEHSGVQVTVGISGTGGGFERFCRGETDLSDASRPIKDEEAAICRKNGIEYSEFLVANDGIAVIVNTQNDWVDCLTVAQLKKIWQPGSKIDSWKDVDASFPDEALKLYGPGTDSGTFDFFTDKINGEEGASRSDYSATENDNVTVRGVSGEKGGLGYFGLSYFEDNRSKLKDVKIDGGGGCVAPNRQTVQGGTYKPLSRPLFVYAKTSSFTRPEVKAFIRFVIDKGSQIAAAARFVPLTAAQQQTASREFEQAAG